MNGDDPEGIARSVDYYFTNMQVNGFPEGVSTNRSAQLPSIVG